MVTMEPQDADGWSISLINDGKHFLEFRPSLGGGMSVNPSLPVSGLCKSMFGGSLEPERGGRQLGNFHFFSFNPPVEVTLGVCEIC